MAAREAYGRIESMIPENSGESPRIMEIAACAAHPSLTASTITCKIITYQPQGAPSQFRAVHKRNPLPQIGLKTSLSSSLPFGEQMKMFTPVYDVTRIIVNSRQHPGFPSRGQTIDQPTQYEAIEAQELQLPRQDAVVQGHVPSSIRVPIVQSSTASAYTPPMLQRRIELPVSAQSNIRVTATYIPQKTVYFTRRLPEGSTFRGTRYSNDPRAGTTQGESQVQQVPLSGNSHPSSEQKTRQRSVFELCRLEDQNAQEELVSRIEQFVIQISNDLKTQSDRLEQRLNQMLNTLRQTTTKEMPNIFIHVTA